MRNSFECDKSIKHVANIYFLLQSQAILNQFHGCILLFFQNDITTVSYVILYSETYEIPCFEKKKSHERP